MPGAVRSRPVATRDRLVAYQVRVLPPPTASDGMRGARSRYTSSWLSTYCTARHASRKPGARS